MVGLPVSGKQSSGLREEPPSTKASVLNGANSSMMLGYKKSITLEHPAPKEQQTPVLKMQISPNALHFQSDADL